MNKILLVLLKAGSVFLLIYLFEKFVDFLFIGSCLDNGGQYVDQDYPVLCEGYTSIPRVGHGLRFAFMGMLSVLIVWILDKIECRFSKS